MADYDTHNRRTPNTPRAEDTANLSARKSSDLPVEQVAYDFTTPARAVAHANPAVNSAFFVFGRNDCTNVGYIDTLPGNVADSAVWLASGLTNFVAFPANQNRVSASAFRIENTRPAVNVTMRIAA